MGKLPIEAKLAELKTTLETNRNAVLVAPPGSGKTTRVPLALLESPWLEGKRILMLEPRRLAARAAARYMASLLGEHVGETVGYRVRLDTRVGPKTRVEVITEGVLTRLLQADPTLEDVGLVIFDEFHERSLQADVGLALCLQSQALLREDLRLLVMSATLDSEAVAQLMGDAPIIQSEGRQFPVETRFLPRRAEERIESAVVRAVADALEHSDGDLLVFLPGVGEIRRVEARLAEIYRSVAVRITPLYGNLSQEEQDMAIAPSQPGVRKIVLATSIAETSLTVEGVKVVIDSGLMRVPRFSPRTGMTRLETVNVTWSSAEQRRGRAGRLGPGVCYRLWTAAEDARLVVHGKPEIMETDLAPLALELVAWGVTDPEELSWLDPPPAAAYQQARELLQQLGAIGETGVITPHGRQMAELGMHPRLAHMILLAMPLGYGAVACELAALLQERDIFQKEQMGTNSDVRLRLEALQQVRETRGIGQSFEFRNGVNLAACRQVLIEASHWIRSLGIQHRERKESDACGVLLAFAYPDRIGQRRADGRYLLRNGRGAAFLKKEVLANEPYLVAAELDDQGTESRIYLAATVSLDEIVQHVGDQIVEEIQVEWEPAAQAVRARKRKRLGALILQEVPVAEPSPEATVSALCKGIQTEGIGILPWKKAARQLQQRMQFMHDFSGDEAWPDVSDQALLAMLEESLAPHLYGMKSRADLQGLHLVGILEALLSWEQRRELDEHAPTHVTVPSGSRIPVDYSESAAPVLAVRLQEMFGLQATPRIAKGRVPLTLHLLSPAQRPVQVTQDLANFWKTTYFEVRKDLRGRYPKHYWPDDPLEAIPTHRAKPRT